MRRFGIDAIAIQGNGAKPWNLKASDHIHTGRLTSAIRADKPNNPALLERKSHVNERFENPNTALIDLSHSDKNLTLLFLRQTLEVTAILNDRQLDCRPHFLEKYYDQCSILRRSKLSRNCAVVLSSGSPVSQSRITA